MKKNENELIETDLFLQKMYNECNELYFNNELPSNVRVKWSTRLTVNAAYCLMKRVKEEEKVYIYPDEIVLSLPYYKRYPAELRDILLHEMIHVKYPYEIHGKCFKSELSKLNNTYDLNIRVKSTGVALVNFIYTCLHCGHEYPRAKVLEHLEEYTCICGGELCERKVSLNNE